jgi:hypothetical protein
MAAPAAFLRVLPRGRPASFGQPAAPALKANKDKNVNGDAH